MARHFELSALYAGQGNTLLKVQIYIIIDQVTPSSPYAACRPPLFCSLFSVCRLLPQEAYRLFACSVQRCFLRKKSVSQSSRSFLQEKVIHNLDVFFLFFFFLQENVIHNLHAIPSVVFQIFNSTPYTRCMLGSLSLSIVRVTVVEDVNPLLSSAEITVLFGSTHKSSFVGWGNPLPFYRQLILLLCVEIVPGSPVKCNEDEIFYLHTVRSTGRPFCFSCWIKTKPNQTTRLIVRVTIPYPP